MESQWEIRLGFNRQRIMIINTEANGSGRAALRDADLVKHAEVVRHNIYIYIYMHAHAPANIHKHSQTQTILDISNIS